MMWALGWIVVALSTFATDSDIVRRHDRPDADYLALGAQFPAVAKLGGRMGDGTLVRPEWILTAAHVADGMLRRGSRSVVVDGESYEAREIYLHPSWRQMGPHDVAVIRLDRAVQDVEPMPLYRGSEELGAVATIVGHGMHGDGRSGPTGDDGRRRGATNRIEAATDRHLLFVFDEGPEATELEGIPAGGDSGGPALLEVDGELRVAGVSSMGEPGRNGPATYDARDYFVRVSTHIEWIDAALAGQMTPAGGPVGDEQVVEATRPVGGSPREELLRSLVDALGPDGDPSGLSGFAAERFSESLLAEYESGALDDELASIRNLLAQATELDVGFDGGGFDLTVLGPEGRLGVVAIGLEAGPPPRISALSLR